MDPETKDTRTTVLDQFDEDQEYGTVSSFLQRVKHSHLETWLFKNPTINIV